MPGISGSTLELIRSGYGLILLASLTHAFPQRRRFFLSERWGGYAASFPDVDAVQNPRALPWVLAAWVSAGACLAAGKWSLAAALVNAALCHYFFIHMRWKGLLRGMGAPGFMLWWLGVVVLLLEFARDRSPRLLSVALLAAQADFAIIMITAGIAKVYGGYARGHGMELGLANPMWGYSWRRWSDLDPDHWIFRGMNHLAWSVEIAAGVLMLIPATRALGGLLILASFAFIALNIRLSILCETVMLCCLLFLPASPGDGGFSGIAAPLAGIDRAAACALWAYLALRPVALAGLCWNFYGRKTLPVRVQWALDRYANLFGIILWRVFTADVVDFHVQIYRQRRGGGPRSLLSRYECFRDLRFHHVGEAITVTSLFTTLRYYPDRRAFFEEKLLRYASTLEIPPGEELVFVLVMIRKAGGRFEHAPATEFIVDSRSRSVREFPLNGAILSEWLTSSSIARPAVVPGSYAPAAK